MSKWWKCDLQVATPGEARFRGESTWNLETPEGRRAAADDYMQRAAAVGLEVLVLADHNSVDWADEMIEAGRRVGITVFPGFEVTTATGSDGAHLVVFADPTTPVTSLGELLISACGFGVDYPKFNPGQEGIPASAPKTMPQILDGLDNRFLAIAPHIFTDNGIGSKNTVQGDLRWKVLHHDRLGAVDVGNVDFEIAGDPPPKASYRQRFIRRELDSLPGLRRLPFIATSDTYALENLGSRFTWIRMETPTLEAIRQAFLDYEARVICDWDSRYAGTEKTPNDVSHAWVKQLTITGASSTKDPVNVSFDPRLTVIIGGRGAGKSTVVAGLRHLYGDIDALPIQARREAEQLRSAVFSTAVLTSTHVLPFSAEEQTGSWTLAGGSMTVRGDGVSTPTEFPVRVISQKELFERAAVSEDGADSTSRNLLKLVDDALSASGHLALARFSQQLDERRTSWVGAARQAQTEREAVQARPGLFEAVQELERQVAAFDDDANRVRRTANDRADREAKWLDSHHSSLSNALEEVGAEVENQLAVTESHLPAETDQFSEDAREHLRRLAAVKQSLKAELDSSIARAVRDVNELIRQLQESPWAERIADARRDGIQYVAELAQLGLDPSAYEAVRASLAAKQSELAEVDRRIQALPELEEGVTKRWAELASLLESRFSDRSSLLNTVSKRSSVLRFQMRRRADLGSWVDAVRALLNLRADGFIDDVPALAEWLWVEEPAAQNVRFALWQSACISGDFSAVAAEANLRATWVQRLANVDPLVRVRLAAEVADDSVKMEFLRYGHSTSGVERWEPLLAGSPGQRSAAMLSFVLHQGNEPLVLDQPEDDLDTEWISELVVRQLRASRWVRQVIVVTHNANIPVNADAERVVVLENAADSIRVRTTVHGNDVAEHAGALENVLVRADIQRIMEGGVEAFVRRERRYNNEVNSYRLALQEVSEK
ncbi:hypothetical protein EDF48_1124 [Curtobacterium sp. PhB191]|uniref:TrlF family AAA-like ATPase n=1 Tax=Curtobacterium sp. PhB191 TaxID=2485202 RepID=UPI0010506227|nr:hypothetical protein [Curtobacterium sp. PhB191]TCU82252.1 hypothetical protein EDF48_1124 [Curtobacterium sp. PhB191]